MAIKIAKGDEPNENRGVGSEKEGGESLTNLVQLLRLVTFSHEDGR